MDMYNLKQIPSEAFHGDIVAAQSMVARVEQRLLTATDRKAGEGAMIPPHMHERVQQALETGENSEVYGISGTFIGDHGHASDRTSLDRYFGGAWRLIDSMSGTTPEASTVRNPDSEEGRIHLNNLLATEGHAWSRSIEGLAGRDRVEYNTSWTLLSDSTGPLPIVRRRTAPAQDIRYTEGARAYIREDFIVLGGLEVPKVIDRTSEVTSTLKYAAENPDFLRADAAQYEHPTPEAVYEWVKDQHPFYHGEQLHWERVRLNPDDAQSPKNSLTVEEGSTVYVNTGSQLFRVERSGWRETEVAVSNAAVVAQAEQYAHDELAAANLSAVEQTNLRAAQEQLKDAVSITSAEDGIVSIAPGDSNYFASDGASFMVSIDENGELVVHADEGTIEVMATIANAQYSVARVRTIARVVSEIEAAVPRDPKEGAISIKGLTWAAKLRWEKTKEWSGY